MTRIKICGLRTPQEMRLCAYLGVEWVGFVFHPASPRYLTAEEAARLHEFTPPAAEGGPLRVGLFVKPAGQDIETILRTVPLDIVQLYAPTKDVVALCRQMGLPVWLSKGIRTRADLPQDGSTDGYVLEAASQLDDTRPGGLGRRFDWSLTAEWQAPAPWLLAGGLTPENVGQAIRLSNAPAVDVSSGVEDAPGRKSARLIEKFVQNAAQGSCQ